MTQERGALLHLTVETSAAPIAPRSGERFVHLCHPEQLEEVRRRHFFGQEIRVVEIDPAALDPALLVEEDLYGHGRFPHYYAPIPESAVRARVPIGPVTRSEVEAALRIVRRFFPPTPLLFAPRLSRHFGAEIWLKLDTLTPIRAFKLRGALAKIDALSRTAGLVGVITASAGNHGLAVAWAARRYGLPCVVVVPERANPRKIEAITAEGAEVIHHGVDYQSALEESARIGEARRLASVHAYDDPAIIAGQGTIALELEATDVILTGVGGGGLIAGIAAAIEPLTPRPELIGVQPEGADSMARSLEAGTPIALPAISTTADGLAARRPGDLAFALCRRAVRTVLRVSDEELIRAIGFLVREERIIAEPAGIAGLAALVRRPELARGRVTVLISGSNVADPVLARALAESAQAAP